MSGVSNAVPGGSHIMPVDNINRTLQIAKTGSGFSVTFKNVVQPSGDGPLDIRIYHDSLVAYTLDTANCDWEFDHSAAVTLGTPGTPGNRYKNLSLQYTGQRCTGMTFEAAWLNIPGSNSDPYNMTFIVYTDPATGATYPTPLSVFIDPDIKNPGH
jgi:hypothetical protein